MERSPFSKFVYDFQVAICIGFGILGFFICVLLLTCRNGQERGKEKKRDTPYGEIVVSNKDSLVTNLLTERTKKLNRKLDSITNLLSAAKLKSPSAATEDMKVMQKSVGQLQAAIQHTVKELDMVGYNYTDSAMTRYTRYIFPDKEEFAKALNSDAWNGNDSVSMCVNATIMDTSVLAQPRIKYEAKLILKQHKRAEVMDFVTDYPQFGLWLVLSIAQMTLWFLLIPLLTGNLLNLDEQLNTGEPVKASGTTDAPAETGDTNDQKIKKSFQKPEYSISVRNILKRCSIPVVFIIVFCFCFFEKLADSYVITDGHFFTGYNGRMRLYALIGYGVAAFCFGTYLFLVKLLSVLDKSAKELDVKRSDDSLKEKYNSLIKAFDNSFLASAVILSFFVLWTGVTINAVNSTEAIYFYAMTTGGKPFIPNDFVYLLGLLHTCILLVFYLPVKLKFNSLQITKDTDDAIEKKPLSAGGIFTALGQSLGPILVTTSPLIAGIVQQIFEALTKG